MHIKVTLTIVITLVLASVILMPYAGGIIAEMSVAGGKSGYKRASDVFEKLVGDTVHVVKSPRSMRIVEVSTAEELSILYLKYPRDGIDEEQLKGVIKDREIIDKGCTRNCLCVGRRFAYESDAVVSLVGCEDLSQRGADGVMLSVGDKMYDGSNPWRNSAVIGREDKKKDTCPSLDDGERRWLNEWAFPACVYKLKYDLVTSYVVRITGCPNVENCVMYDFTWTVEEYEGEEGD